jgi:hypothetical protein
MSTPTPQQILNTPMDDNDSGADSIGGYLTALLTEIWREGECFSGKRPFGNSGWEVDLYLPLVKAGYISGTIDEDGYLDDEDRVAGCALIVSAIEALAPTGAALPGIYPSSPAPTGPHYRTGNKNGRNLYQVNADGTETHFGCMFHEHAGPLVVEALNQWEQRKQAVARGKEKASTPRLQWHHGPTAADPDPGKIWHAGCGGEILCIDGGLICCDCDAQEEGREACELPLDWRTQVTAVSSWTADEVVALVEEWQGQA